ncbi:predicted Zn-dependent peptidase [Bacillus oleivorans]|uniref:Predicted Zn-dependent peptidase n=1 Tax=Bacillus oleivorans TaxID=1448271 RepID=A0A285D6A9_9BACI|nr:pitrilysin family protein [Bacillus oleivorans]SNX75364.1 predicted Zn-dependent peptidase [Bacillus oleivorans]
MSVLHEEILEGKGFRLHVVKADQFKTNTLVFKMKTPLNREDITIRALLPYVLQASTQKYPTTTKLRSYLDELYGTSLYVDLAKKGEYHVITFSVDIANEKFLKDQTPLLEKAFELLSEILLKPLVMNDAFDKQSVEQEKRTLKQRIQAVYDDKMRYAGVRLVEEMCKEEPYSLPLNGFIEDVDPITPSSLYQYYAKAFTEDELDLFVVGDVEVERVKEFAAKWLQFSQRAPKLIERRTSNERREVKEVKEPQNVKQGKLNIGYRTHIFYGDEDYYALQVMNGLLGGFSHSKLFINVREKASLAYYAASRLESHKGLLLIMTGIDMKNYDQTVSIVKEQVNAMQNGDFTEQEIDQTKAVIRNQMLETIDTPRGMIEVLYHNVVSKQTVLLNDWLEKTDHVSKEQIVETAKKLELDTIYFLTGKEQA